MAPNCFQNEVNPLIECTGHDIFLVTHKVTPQKTKALRNYLGGEVPMHLNSPRWELLGDKQQVRVSLSPLDAQALGWGRHRAALNFQRKVSIVILIGGAGGVTRVSNLQRLIWLIDRGVSKMGMHEPPTHCVSIRCVGSGKQASLTAATVIVTSDSTAPALVPSLSQSPPGHGKKWKVGGYSQEGGAITHCVCAASLRIRGGWFQDPHRERTQWMLQSLM